MERQSEISDFITVEPIKCSCGREPRLHISTNDDKREFFSYMCDCGMWQGNGSYSSYASQKAAVADWNKQNHRQINKLYRDLKNLTCELILQDMTSGTKEQMIEQIKKMIVK